MFTRINNQSITDLAKKGDYKKCILLVPLPADYNNNILAGEFGMLVRNQLPALYHAYMQRCEYLLKTTILNVDYLIDAAYIDSDPNIENTEISNLFMDIKGAMCYYTDPKDKILRINMHSLISCCNKAFDDYGSSDKIIIPLPGSEEEKKNPIAILEGVFMYSPFDIAVVG